MVRMAHPTTLFHSGWYFVGCAARTIIHYRSNARGGAEAQSYVRCCIWLSSQVEMAGRGHIADLTFICFFSAPLRLCGEILISFY